MFVVGLTGGIAAGKTLVSARLASHGAAHIDADKLAREVVEPGSAGLRAIAERFGPTVLSDDGSLDRAALGSIVFADPDARRALESITHPAVRQLSQQRMREAVADNASRVVVYDVPLLVESRGAGEFDHVVVVHTPRAERISRLVDLRGMTRADAERRVDAQATDEARLAVADDVVDSSTSVESTLEQTDRLAEKLQVLARAKASRE